MIDDLNLLRTLDALLDTGSVTGAALRLGLSQPAVSRALQRLRHQLDDPLFVRQGRGLVPTSRAEALRPTIREIMGSVQAVDRIGVSFDPATARRTFRMLCPDAMAPIVPDILVSLADAPHLHIELVHYTEEHLQDEVDLVFGLMPDHAPGVVCRPLGPFEFVVAMGSKHPATRSAWTMDAYLQWPHVRVRTASTGFGVVERIISAKSPDRHIGLTVPSHLLAAQIIASTHYLFTSTRQLLQPLASDLGLALLPAPMTLPVVRPAAMWPERVANDPGHRWFRQRVLAVVLERLSSDGDH